MTSLAPSVRSVPISVISSQLGFLLLNATLSACLIPVSIVIFFFSTPHLRREPHFILNLCAIALGLAQGAIGMYTSICTMMFELGSLRQSTLALVCLYALVPMCVEAILLLRVIAVYPPRQFPLLRRIAIYGPMTVVKVARVANALYFIYELHHQHLDHLINGVGVAVWTMPYVKVEWFLQLFDNTYVSALFLSKLYAGKRLGSKHSSSAAPRDSFPQRLKTLFWIAVSNFVFPILFNIVQLVLVFWDHDFVHGGFVLTTNNYVTIIGVLLATIWSSGSHWQQRDIPTTDSTTYRIRVDTETYVAYSSPPSVVGSSCIRMIGTGSSSSSGTSVESSLNGVKVSHERMMERDVDSTVALAI